MLKFLSVKFPAAFSYIHNIVPNILFGTTLGNICSLLSSVFAVTEIVTCKRSDVKK